MSSTDSRELEVLGANGRKAELARDLQTAGKPLSIRTVRDAIQILAGGVGIKDMGQVHAARFYRGLAKGLKPRRPSVLARIHAAKNAEELHFLIADTLTLEASPGTKRKWRELAERRLADFRAQTLVAL